MTSVPKVLDSQSDSSAREEMTQPVTAEKKDSKYSQLFYEQSLFPSFNDESGK